MNPTDTNRCARRSRIVATFAVICGIAAPMRANAQAALLGPGAVYLSAGASHLQTRALDDRLALHGFPTFGPTAGAISLGAYRTLSSGVMVGAEWHGLGMGEEVHEGREVGLGGGYGTLGVGYRVNLSRKVTVYPRVGIGGGGLGIWSEVEADTVDFGVALEHPQARPYLRENLLSRDGVVYDLGAGAELLPGGRSGLLLAIRFGYLAAPFDSEWDNYDRKAANGPDASISGPYVRLAIGAAWNR